MNGNILKAVIIAVIGIFSAHNITAQEVFDNNIRFEKTVHDFGTLLLRSGAVKCTFEFENVSSKPFVVYSVTTSCGCTDLDWTKEPVKPGGKGHISVVYSNDEGPYPFDKAVTAYVTGCEKPVILRIRGVCTEKEKSLSEIYTKGYGAFGMIKREYNLGNIDRGKSRKDEAYVANLSGKPINISFTDVSKGLKVSVSPNPLPANSLGKIIYEVATYEGMWGKNNLVATPVVDGKKQSGDPISIRCFVKDDFSGMTAEQKRNAPVPLMASSTYNAGVVGSGKTVEGYFTIKNQGRSPLKIHKIEADYNDIEISDVPEVAPGKSAEIHFRMTTSGFAPGEDLLVIITLTTNAPGRPMVNLFVTGSIR